MVILQVINSLSSGGAEVLSVNLAIELNKINNNKVYFVTYSGVLDAKGEFLKTKLINNGIEYISLDYKTNLKKILIPIRYLFLFKKIKPNIIHSHLDQSDFFVFLAGLVYKYINKNVKFYRTFHTNNLIKRIPLFIHKMMFNFYDFNIACSLSVKNKFQLKKKNLVYVNNGIPLNEISGTKQIILKEIFHDYKDQLIFINIGSMNLVHGVQVKGQDVLINAVSLLPDHYKEKLKVMFVGDGVMRHHYESMIKKLKLNEYFYFTGKVINPFDFIRVSNVAIFPSRFEGLPIAAIECVVSKLPLICTTIEAFEIFSGNSIRKIPVNNSEETSKAMMKMIDNYNVYNVAAKKKVDFFKKEFDIKNTAKKYNNLYIEEYN